MNLSPYIASVRDGVASAASLADEHTQQVAHRLGAAVESSTRLALIHALSDAAGTISAELAPSSVELRMVGADPEFAVTVQPVDSEPPVLLAEPQTETVDPPTDLDDTLVGLEDEPVSRITLRIPQSVKSRVDEMASADGISTNAWLIRAVMDALAGRLPTAPWPQPPTPPSPGTIFGPHGPFGPHGVFGQNGPFGMFGDRGRSPARPDHPTRPRGNVQGWVR